LIKNKEVVIDTPTGIQKMRIGPSWFENRDRSLGKMALAVGVHFEGIGRILEIRNLK